MTLSFAPRTAPIHAARCRHTFYHDFLTMLRRHYLALLDSLSDESWYVPCNAAGQSVGELMVHLYLNLATLPAALNGIRMGTGYLSVPIYMKEHAAYWKAKTNAAFWTRRTIAVAYDYAHYSAIAALQSVGAGEWWLSATVWGEPDTTVEALFLGQGYLFARHYNAMAAALGWLPADDL